MAMALTASNTMHFNGDTFIIVKLTPEPHFGVEFSQIGALWTNSHYQWSQWPGAHHWPVSPARWFQLDYNHDM